MVTVDHAQFEQRNNNMWKHNFKMGLYHILYRVSVARWYDVCLEISLDESNSRNKQRKKVLKVKSVPLFPHLISENYLYVLAIFNVEVLRNFKYQHL